MKPTKLEYLKRLLFESGRGVTHGTLRRSQGGKGTTMCGRQLAGGWMYRGDGTPTCKQCKQHNDQKLSHGEQADGSQNEKGIQ